MNRRPYRVFCLILLLAFAVAPGHGQETVYSDGPYIRERGEGFDILRVDEGGPEWEEFSGGGFAVTSSDGKHRFDVSLHEAVVPEWDYPMAEKVTVLSDPHGNMDALVSILRSSGVMDDSYSWNYGDGHLFVLGDIFDRGNEVLPIYWLVYKLAGEAGHAGGMVHFLPGNHEDMVLHNDLRYTDPKYTDLAETLGMEYKDFWRTDRVLGKWLATRNFMERMGRYLFTHAGISERVVERGLGIEAVNETMRDYFHSDWDTRFENPDAELLFLMNGPLWYRGMVEPDEEYFDPIDEEGVDRVLAFYGVEKLFVGHTIFDDVSSFFGGRVIGVNVDNAANMEQGHSRGVSIEDGRFYLLYDDPERKKEWRP